MVPENHNPHGPRGIVPWDAPRMFDGEIVCIIGGGPSLKTFDISVTKGHRCIAVNQSFEIAPWAEVLHFADCPWWRWNHVKVLKEWKEPKIITTATSDVSEVYHPRLKRFWRDRNKFNTDRRRLHGWDSGTQATNLAWVLGARKIVLFGIDMQVGPKGEAQWHNKHKVKTNTCNYAKFAAKLGPMCLILRGMGVEVVRATQPGIPEAPWQPLDQALS